MTEQICEYPGCRCPSTTYLCKTHTLRLRQELTDLIDPDTGRDGTPLPTLLDELVTTFSRQARIGDGDGGRRSADTPLPWHKNAADALDRLRKVLSTWAGLTLPHPVAMDIVGHARWILAHGHALAIHPNAGIAAADIIEAIEDARYVIDRAPVRLFAGQCRAEIDGEECREFLYALDDQERVRCRSCGTEWFTAELRRWLVEVAETSVALTATTMAGLFCHAGVSVTPARIRSLASRGRIEVRGKDARGHPMYLIDEVREALAARYQRLKPTVPRNHQRVRLPEAESAR